MLWRLEIDTSNDAFTAAPAAEIARILRESADKVDALQDSGITEGSQSLKDANGNTVGGFDFVRPVPAPLFEAATGERCACCGKIHDNR